MAKYQDAVKKPGKLSPRVRALRDYYFEGVSRRWNNEYNCYTTGVPWDLQFDELTYYIVPEVYTFFDTFASSVRQNAETVPVEENFYKLSVPERKAVFTKKVAVDYIPKEILPGDLLAGARFNALYSMCLTEKEQRDRDKRVKKARRNLFYMHSHGYGNGGATCGHLIPDYARILREGFSSVYDELQSKYEALGAAEKKGGKGAQLRAMMTACEMPRDVAQKYSELCAKEAAASDGARRAELEKMAENLKIVPWHGANDFYQAVQSLWLTHMLVMTDEKYPGPGLSFGRLDQYLYPYYKRSVEEGMTEDFMKEILGCFWFHCNTAYDAQMRVGGNQGITAGFGQLFSLSGLKNDGSDGTNELTYLLLDVIDAMSPILEPKPNVRLHRGSPEKLLDRIVDMVSVSQGAPFLLNFDERSIAGMLRQAEKSGGDLINDANVRDYASVGCLENTMAGNDRSGTVDVNVNLLKAMELVFGNGRDMLPYLDEMTGKYSEIVRESKPTGTLDKLDTFEKFYGAFAEQLAFVIRRHAENYELSESIRADYNPTPYLSCLVGGCAERALDVTRGGAELSFVTMEGISYATVADSLLSVKYLVYDKKICSLSTLADALRSNWKGYEKLQAAALHKAPKYGRDDDEADALAERVMKTWSEECWKYSTKSTNRRFRPGMLSWNYWVGDGYIMKASANGREEEQFLSNAICPSNGADINGPTSNANSVGKVLGGKSEDGFMGYVNYLPNGASHTISFNTSLVKDERNKEKFKMFLKGYTENGGTALQINILDPEVLKDAQLHPKEYRHLLVRVTGYNAYFTSIGRELQDEIIARESHKGF